MEFTEQIPTFLEGFLSRPAYALPKGAQWVVDFENLTDVRTAIVETINNEPTKWNLEQSLQFLVQNANIANKGCFFLQAVSIPEESMVANPEGLHYNHYLRTITGQGRNPNTGLRMTFLNTNLSFVENVIRPWVVTTARLGLVARPQNQTYRQRITVYKLGFRSSFQSPFILEKYTFHGTCPIEVNSEEYNYTTATTPTLREAVFTYHYYDIDTSNATGYLVTDATNVPPLPLSTPTRGANVFTPSIPGSDPDPRYRLS